MNASVIMNFARTPIIDIIYPITVWKHFLAYFAKFSNQLEPRSGPTFVGPDLGPSWFASDTTLFWKKMPEINILKSSRRQNLNGGHFYPHCNGLRNHLT